MHERYHTWNAFALSLSKGKTGEPVDLEETLGYPHPPAEGVVLVTVLDADDLVV